MAYTTINKSSDYFNTKLYTGNGSSQSITGIGFKPDFTWVKNRDTSAWHTLVDIVRGVTKTQYSNRADAQGTYSSSINAFNSDGFTVGNSGDVNNNGSNLVAWNWLAGGSQGSSNTDGSINTTYTSANTTSGFSITQYTGTGANATVGHGLGVTPKMYICKSFNEARSWAVYHQSMGNTKAVFLNSTDAQDTDNPYWNATSPTNSTVSLGHRSEMNHSGEPYIMYCFADVPGYSKFGSYVGNGSTDGTFVYTGFKPSLIIQKNISATGNWILYDNKRDVDNVADKILIPNSNSAEASACDVDLLSNGFKFRAVNDASSNKNGNTYIYMAFASAPLVGSNGVTAKAR
tara:strand:- start:3 stop:1040 length:1038 start_codon:yes stop_codon:yes gene_type:complete